MPKSPLELHEAPNSERIPVLLRRNPLELAQRALPVAAVVEEVAQVDARLVQIGIETQRATDLTAGADLVPEPRAALGGRARPGPRRRRS